jgi:hypothetical protein
MVGQRAKHLSHSEAAAAVTAEAGFAVGHRDLQGHAAVLGAGIVCMGAQARQDADADIADDDFERAWPRGECNKAGARRLAVAEDIVLQLAKRADNLGGDPRREAGGEGGLIGPARPELPEVGSFAIWSEPPKREDAGLCVLFGASHRVTVKRGLNCRNERRFKYNGCEGLGVSLARAHQFDQGPDLSGPLHANGSHAGQTPAFGSKKKFVSGIEVADDRLPLFLSFRLHCLRSCPQAQAGRHPDDARGPEPP